VVRVKKQRLSEGRIRKMALNELRDEIYRNAVAHGFHIKDQVDLSKKLLLVITECCEAVEAERKGWGSSAYT
jgi:hypothetical protein